MLYLLGRQITTELSLFSANIPGEGKWWLCNDTGKACSKDTDCSHACNHACVVRIRAGSSLPLRRCFCNNNTTRVCSTDSECTAGATCKFSAAPPSLEQHAACLSNVRYAGNDPSSRVSACLLQALAVPGGAADVVHFAHGNQHYLVFASGEDGGSAPLFAAQDGSPSKFVMVAPAPCKGTLGLRAFFSQWADTFFLLCSLGGGGSGAAMLRWNGTNFLDLVDPLRLSPADAAGGQLLPYPAARAAEFLAVPGIAGITPPAEFVIVGGGQAADELGPWSVSSLFRALYETADLSGPVALTISPGKGEQVYVANLLGRNIAAFLRNSSTGALAHAPWLVAEAVPSAGSLGRLSAIAVAPDGSNVYSVDMSSGSLHYFRRLLATGALVHLGVIQAPSDARLEGPCSLLILPPSNTSGRSGAGDGGDVFVAALSGQSIVHFSRNMSSGGWLAYSDAVWNGERDLATMETVLPSPDILPSGNENAQNVKYPMRLLANRSWGGAVSAARQFDAAGRRMLAVAASGASGGAIIIMEWNPILRTFATVQEITSQVDAVDLAPFEIPALPGSAEAEVGADNNKTYLAVASASGLIMVYQYDVSSETFSLHHQLPAPEVPIDSRGCNCVCSSAAAAAQAEAAAQAAGSQLTCVPCLRDDDGTIQTQCGALPATCHMAQSRPQPGRIRFFRASGSAFLAVAGLDVAAGEAGGCSGRSFTVVYRWRDGRVLMTKPAALRDTASRFEVFQVNSSFDSVSILTELFDFGGSFRRLYHPLTDSARSCPLQVISLSGGADVDSAIVPHADLGNITVLAIASFADGGPGVSLVFRFLPAAANALTGGASGRFVLHQQLQTSGAWAMRVLLGDYGGKGPLLAVVNRQNMSYPAARAIAASKGWDPVAIYDAAEAQVIVIVRDGRFLVLDLK